MNHQLPLLLAFDLDGTLLAERSDFVPEHTAAALQQLRQLGVKLAVITGRDMVPQMVIEVMQPHAIATNNGGRIHVAGQLELESKFSPEDLEAILAHELEDAHITLFTTDGLYATIPQDTQPSPWLQKRGYKPLEQAPKQGISKVSYHHAQVVTVADSLRRSHPHLVATGGQDPYPYYLSVTPEGAHKGAALLFIADALGIPHDRTIAFGDSDNDEIMLKMASYAVQVGQLPLLVPHANQQLKDHEETGHFLEALLSDLNEQVRQNHF